MSFRVEFALCAGCKTSWLDCDVNGVVKIDPVPKEQFCPRCAAELSRWADDGGRVEQIYAVWDGVTA